MVWQHLEQQIAHSVAILKQGGVVVFPTETAYALGADATNAKAVDRIFEIKGRKEDKPLPLIADSREMVERFAHIPPVLEELVTRYWPGALTLVLPSTGSGLAGGVVRDGTIAVRVSSHKVARALSRGLDHPIVSTSANRAGEVACYSIPDVKAQLTQHTQPDFYIDVGMLQPRPPSTIVAVDTDGYPKILRQGMIGLKQDLDQKTV